MKAAENGHIEVCEWLFENGADVNMSNKVRLGRPEQVAAAVNQMYRSFVNFLIIVTNSRFHFLLACLFSHEWGVTAFMKAAENGHIEVCKWLFDHGADANMTDVVRVGHA